MYWPLWYTALCFHCAVLALYSQQRPFCGIWRSKNGLRMLSMAKRLGSMSLNSPIVKQGLRKFWKSWGPLVMWWTSWLVTELQKNMGVFWHLRLRQACDTKLHQTNSVSMVKTTELLLRILKWLGNDITRLFWSLYFQSSIKSWIR